MEILEELNKLKDKDYARFQIKLTPGVKEESVIGVRVPLLRTLAKKLVKEKEYEAFLNELPHEYYDENMLHSLIISEIKNYDECLKYIDAFLPYVDNWAVCDIMSPKVLKKDLDKTICKIKEWIKSKETYTSRFGIEMLMSFYLDEHFKEDYLKMVAEVKSDEYYLKMMIAWYFATALAKKWDSSIKYIEDKKLDIWTHNKTIQKATESYRIKDEDKAYLRSLKIKKG